MKKAIKYLLVAVMLLVTAVSCEMERFPFDNIEQSQAFKTIEDAESVGKGLYSDLRARLHGIYMYSTDVQADMLNATIDFGNRQGFPHRWTGFLATDYTIRDIWRGYYNSLVDVNNVINNIDNIPVEDAGEQAIIDKIKGEAYFLRAYYYHQLVLRYAKDYDPASASTDLGVPLVLTFDITLLPSRATVEEVYQQILLDLGEAETLLADIDGSQSAARLTSDCVTSMYARVKLCMHDFTGAIQDANSLITGAAYPLISDAVELKAMWEDDISSEVIFQFPLTATELGNSNGIYLRYNAGLDPRPAFIPDFVPQQWVVDMYEDIDIRKDVYLEQKELYLDSYYYQDIWLINKYPGNPVLFEGANSNYQQMPKVFRIAEMYLISAEAAAQNPSTEADALATLNLLRTSRGIAALSGLTGTDLMDAIKEERTREFLCEGTRLDDLKRWNMGFTRTAPQDLTFIELGEDYHLKTVLAGDDKFVWGIPTNDLTSNPNIADQQNPGW